ncbi:MAG TPA: 3'-5' exonuclease [Steroidobacteraceae bacterium]|nr:3'-5' exonuclease [Steroidobacteraceae bacterium]
MNTLVFDIETVPDVEWGRHFYSLQGLDDAAVAKAMFAQQRASTGADFLPHLQQRVVAISCVLRTREQLKVWSLGEAHSSEAELLTRFFDGIDKYLPELVSWNGGGFDLPVLHYRSLKAGVQAPRYWEVGDEDAAFRYNNYLNRFHWRHLDLMDVLSGFQPRARAKLADVAALLGFPGKLGFAGDQVWEAYLAGQILAVRRYCETDALNTYLIFLRFQFLRARLDRSALDEEFERLRALLRASTEPHHAEFLKAWTAAV